MNVLLKSVEIHLLNTNLILESNNTNYQITDRLTTQNTHLWQ